MIKSPHLSLAKNYWKDLLHPGDIAIDATCGNGHDTHFLCQLEVKIFSLDIQDTAIEKAKRLLEKFPNVQILKISHTFIDEIPLSKPPKLIVYNLGYLPGGDKSVTTRWTSTLVSLKKSMKIIDKYGAISITCYPGHFEGALEEEAIIEYLSSLPKEDWIVCLHRYLNRPNSPSFIWMTRGQKSLHLSKSIQEEFEA